MKIHKPSEEQSRFLTKAETIKIVGSARLVERMISATNNGGDWLKIVPPPPGLRKRENLIERASVHAACDRLLRGEQRNRGTFR